MDKLIPRQIADHLVPGYHSRWRPPVGERAEIDDRGSTTAGGYEPRTSTFPRSQMTMRPQSLRPGRRDVRRFGPATPGVLRTIGEPEPKAWRSPAPRPRLSVPDCLVWDGRSDTDEPSRGSAAGGVAPQRGSHASGRATSRATWSGSLPDTTFSSETSSSTSRRQARTATHTFCRCSAAAS